MYVFPCLATLNPPKPAPKPPLLQEPHAEASQRLPHPASPLAQRSRSQCLGQGGRLSDAGSFSTRKARLRASTDSFGYMFNQLPPLRSTRQKPKAESVWVQQCEHMTERKGDVVPRKPSTLRPVRTVTKSPNATEVLRSGANYSEPDWFLGRPLTQQFRSSAMIRAQGSQEHPKQTASAEHSKVLKATNSCQS